MVLKICYTFEEPTAVNLDSKLQIFLAGPTMRLGKADKDYVSWRETAINYFKEVDFDGVIYVPEFAKGITELPEGWTLSRQTEWETKHLSGADAILFWIPRDETLPAFTTNIEFGEYMKSGKIAIGAPKWAERNDYLRERCGRLGIQWNTDLKDVVRQAIYVALRTCAAKLGKVIKEKKRWFTADQHFGSQRTLELCRRPHSSVSSMDMDIISRHNSVVSPEDDVYYLGDFGNFDTIKYLHFGKLYFMFGNYERQISGVEAAKLLLTDLVGEERIEFIEPNTEVLLHEEGIGKIKLLHEPSMGNDPEAFYLFAHIHEKGFIKRNGLNVGVDVNDFYPVDTKRIAFYKNGIQNHYDNEVWISTIGK